MNCIEYRRLHSAARYARRKLHEAYESSDSFYARRMADGTPILQAIEKTASETLRQVPGGLPARGRDQLLRLHEAREWRHRDHAAYDHMRFVCAASRHVLRLIDAAVGCELATRHAVKALKAWRSVA